MLCEQLWIFFLEAAKDEVWNVGVTLTKGCEPLSKVKYYSVRIIMIRKYEVDKITMQ